MVQADVSKEDACDALIRDVEREFGRLDVLLNMASLYESVPFDDLTPKEFDRQLGVDLRGSFLASRAAVPLMRRHGGGRIINFADWVAASGRPRYKGYVAYYVAKAGVKALTEALALELAADQILVNAIAPGPDPGAAGHLSRGTRRRGKGHAAGTMGRPRRNRQGRAGAD